MLVEASLVGWAKLLWKQGEVDRPLEMVIVVLKRTARDRQTQARATPKQTRRAESRAASLEPGVLAKDLLAAAGD
jgi:hypothetical protein